MSEQIEQVYISPYLYAVEYVKKLVGEDGGNLYGQITYADAMIRIDIQHDPQRQGAALIHEVLHGILEHAGLDETDEQVVIVLGNGLFDFLRKNPKVVDYLTTIE